MPVILDAPCELVGTELPASPGYSFGRPGSVATSTFLNRPGGTPSNNTGVNFGLSNGTLNVIATGTRIACTYDLTVYQHDGGFANPTTIAVVSVVAATKAVLVVDVDFVQLNPLQQNRQIAIQVSAGTADNIGVDLQLSGDSN